MITIDTKKLEQLIAGAKTFGTDRKAQEALIELKTAQKILDDALTLVSEALKTSLQEQGLSFVEGDLVKVTLSSAGSRYTLVDSENAPPEVLEVKLNPKAVDAWLEEKNVLPKGVIEKEDRATAIRITIKGVK